MSNQIDVNQLSNALQQKIDLPSGKSQADIDYVVETKAPTDTDPTWYRLYRSGWIEQGGTTGNANTNTVNLPITMANVYYSVIATEYSKVNGTGGYTNPGIVVSSKTTTSFQLRGVYSGSDSHNIWDWQVKGFAATE